METELARTQALLSGLRPADWQRPTDCPGWTVHDIVAHMTGQSEELARPDRLIRRIHRACTLPGTGMLDKRNQLQVQDRAGATQNSPPTWATGDTRQPGRHAGSRRRCGPGSGSA
jgi:uncharacterized protein (TIGR03083 family)